MKKTSILLLLLSMTVSCNSETSSTTQNTQQALKRYEVKSGIISYKTETHGKMMGSTVSGSGTENVYFKDWGAVELIEVNSTETTSSKMFGKSKKDTKTTHTITKLDNGESYVVDFKNQEIYANRDMAMDLTKMFQPNADAGEVGKSMAKGMGGKIVGEESFLGYPCQIMDLMGSKQWIYKGITLKIEMTAMGITTTKEAVSADFDISVADKYFELPDFPMVKQEGFMTNEEFDSDMEDMDENIDALKKMSFEEWKKIATENDEEMQNMSEEELRETYNMMQKMLQMRN